MLLSVNSQGGAIVADMSKLEKYIAEGLTLFEIKRLELLWIEYENKKQKKEREERQAHYTNFRVPFYKGSQGSIERYPTEKKPGLVVLCKVEGKYLVWWRSASRALRQGLEHLTEEKLKEMLQTELTGANVTLVKGKGLSLRFLGELLEYEQPKNKTQRNPANEGAGTRYEGEGEVWYTRVLKQGDVLGQSTWHPKEKGVAFYREEKNSKGEKYRAPWGVYKIACLLERQTDGLCLDAGQGVGIPRGVYASMRVELEKEQAKK